MKKGMNTKNGYKDLIVWRKSMELVTLIYALTASFPKSEVYALTSQMHRAAVSIPSNIAEGSRRKTDKDAINFFVISFSSGAELETQIEIAKRLQYGHLEKYAIIESLLEEVMKMLNKMISISKYSYAG